MSDNATGLMPHPNEPQAVCWNHDTCSKVELCACPCHVKADAVDVVDR